MEARDERGTFLTEQLEHIVETLAEGVIVVDRDGCIMFANTSAENICGVKQSDIFGLPYLVFAQKVTAVDGKPLPEEELPFGRVIRTGEPVYGLEYMRERPDGTKVIVSANAVPLRDATGAVVGAAMSLSDITERKRRRELSDALNDINAAITSMLDFGEIMQRVVVESTKAMGSEAAGVMLREGDYWVIQYAYGRPQQDMIGLRLTDEQAKVVVIAARTKKPVAINDAFHDTRVNREMAKKQGICSLLVVPLTAKEEVIGALFFSYHSAAVAFADIQVDFAGKLAAAISIAMENTRLFEELKRSTDELDKKSKSLQTLLDVALDITYGLKLDELMYKIARNATDLTGADVGGVGLVNEETRVVTYPFIYNLPEIVAATDIPPGRGISGLVVSQKKPLAIKDYQKFPDKIKCFADVGLRAMATIPLWSRGRVIGTLCVSSKNPEKRFSEQDITTLEGIGRHAAITIENARLFETERNIADTLQEALLIMPEHIEGLEFNYLYHSATEVAKVGGDFYDIFEMEHGKVGIIIGDVSGKGLDAATLTSLVKNTIRAYAYEDGSPASIMAKANDMVRKASAPTTFVTVFFGIVDVQTGILTYCSAGHPPAILKRSLREVTLLAANSPIIGAFPDLDYIDDEAALEKGDVLVLYTDGVIEARRDSEFFGENRLVELHKDLESTLAKGLPQKIFEAVIDHAQGRLLDDVALLAVSLEGGRNV